MGVFRDDSTAADKRLAACGRLMALCPAELRPLVQPMIELALSRATDAEIAALLIDVELVQQSAEAGDLAPIVSIAKKYGATDEQVATYLPPWLGTSNGSAA